MGHTTKQKLIPFSLTGLIILLDQLTKGIIVHFWPEDGTFIKDVFGNDFLWIIHVRNKAIAFSLGDNLPDVVKPILFSVLPLILLAVLVWYYMKSSEFTTLQRWALTGIVGGGIGNLIDRIFRPDGVVDFISVKFYGIFGLSRWPTFNIADASVVVCGVILLISIIFNFRPKEAQSNHE
ncbi:signal peptidase II [Breznakiella homolactica]|uniref:Lipoprotein signal peptidase n=1 Tax=Breznakiella homolactica TaxID=2798577 RepID=A0A7T8BA30_9SPIR|nr:signal peptidase II [Breznakiella homolactica]QQO10234.1 signal peptidase II [Breznakiella homolactica]